MGETEDIVENKGDEERLRGIVESEGKERLKALWGVRGMRRD